VIQDGRLMAYSADKGEKLLEIQTGRTGMAPPITYEIDGKQYVALMGGMGMRGVGGGGRAPANAPVDNAPMLFVFTLDGKAELPKPAAPPAPQNGTPAPPAR
jgi:quinohemoprotein ethanol dehydrogenase